MPKGTKVLMVDDDKMLIDLYKERLELAGYQVEVSRDGEEGLAKIHSTKPDLVLLDIMMPKVNGYEMLASIKSDPATKDTPVIILSALMRDINKSKAIESGADDYIIKSEAMPADVIQKIEAVLKKYNKEAPKNPPAPPPAEPSSGPSEGMTAPPAPPENPAPPEPVAPLVQPSAVPSQEIQFEPASAEATAGKPSTTAQAPASSASTVPPAVTPAQPQPSSQPLPQAAVSQEKPPKASPVVIFFLVLIVILILASDLFFYMKYVTGK